MSAVAAVAPGSTLPVDTPPTIAVDPGGWAGIVLRVGGAALDASTVGPVAPRGEVIGPDHAYATLSDLTVLSRHCDRLLARVEAMWDAHEVEAPGGFRVVVEAINPPASHLAGKRSRIPLADWLVPLVQFEAVRARFPGARVVPPGMKPGARHQPARGGTGNPADYYPPALVRQRSARAGSAHFAPNDEPSGTRDHEQSAYDLAAIAWLLDNEGSTP